MRADIWLMGVLAAMPWVARAGSFSVDPIHLEMASSQSTVSLKVTNRGAEPLVLQARIYRWTHDGSTDVLTELEGGEAPIMTPPLFRLAATGSGQVLRIGFLKPSIPIDESQWRVIVEEVPNSSFAGYTQRETAFANDSGQPQAVALRVRVSLPLLQRPKTLQHNLQWSLQSSTPGALRLTADNLGNVTERLDDVRLGVGDDPNSRVPGPLYLFPGERRSFVLQPSAGIPPGAIALRLQGTPRPLTHELVISAP